MNAQDILKKNETAVMIFTDGRGLNINKNGDGTSGVWKIGQNAKVDKVIIYFRNREKNTNEIYLGDFVQLLPSTEKDYLDRKVVEFTNMNFAGLTDSNWNEFTNTRRGAVSPIKYIR